MARYKTYRDNIEAQRNFLASGRSPGNEQRRWHGTKRVCNLGEAGNTTLCTDNKCALCCIIRESFDIKYYKSNTKWGRFGAGIYTSSTSSKSNDYSQSLGVSSMKAMLLNKVVVGRGEKLIQDSPNLTAPPTAGYDSVCYFHFSIPASDLVLVPCRSFHAQPLSILIGFGRSRDWKRTQFRRVLRIQ